MKPIILILISFCFTTMLQAQVSKTVNVTAGSLKITLTSTELNTVTNLTLTGTIDARDFKTMRDDMPVLAVLDLSGATVAAYSGTVGTSNQTKYPANSIPEYAFCNLNTLKGKISLISVKLPSSVTSIGDYSFYNCSGLNSVTLPSSLTSIGTYSFCSCSGLNSVTIPSLVTSIGHGAFNSCNSLSSIDLPSSLTSIEMSVFYGCKSLKSIVIPTSVTFIGAGAFDRCNSLSSIELPSSLTSIEIGVFYGCSSLKSIVIPSSVIFIGSKAFEGCNSLLTVSVPSSVKSIGESAFMSCSKLITITIPSSITIIENQVFSGCSSLISITIPSSVTSIGSYAFDSCSSLTSITIPTAVTSIGEGAFSYCRGLTSITIPVSVTSIGGGAFSNCSGLTSVNSSSSHPVNLTSSPDVFSGIIKTTCILNIPYKAKELYAIADQWKDFTNIVEATQGFLLDSTIVSFSVSGGSAVVNSTANVTWTASSNQTWLSLNPTSGMGNQTITFTAEANQTIGRRTAKVTLSATNVPPQTITIIQEGLPKTITIAAGGLLSGLTADELNSITNLTIIGTIDARDFKTMRDNMPSLAVLDISGTKILAYSGSGGVNYENFKNEIPVYAFSSFINSPTLTGKTSLISIVLPSSVTSIGSSAFGGCIGLTNVTIPASVNSISSGAFADCSGLTSIFANSSVPADLDSGWMGENSFFGVDKTTCTLYVPYGAKRLYSASDFEWKDFKNIVEMAGFMVSAETLYIAAKQGSTTSIYITSNVNWAISSDQPWLTLNKSSGSGAMTLTFIAEANPNNAIRTATITVSAEGVESQTITVTQNDWPTDLIAIAENSIDFKCYPNPFSTETNIKIRNPKQSKVTVDIYNLAGERIKNLINGIADEQIDLTWNGTNDLGNKVAPGVYICNMNNQSKLLIFGKK